MARGVMTGAVVVGAGWRHPHYRHVMAHGAEGVDFLEVHTENFLAPGGASRELIRDASQRHPISLHGVGMGLGSACGLDAEHLRRVRALADEVQPVLMSEHACFARALPGGRLRQAHDLLPLPFTAQALQRLCDQVDQAQEALGRRLLIENLSAYVGWTGDEMPEPLFLNELARRTGCGLLVDVNNLVVNALNEAHGGAHGEAHGEVHGQARGEAHDEAGALAAVQAWLRSIDAASVGQYHLAGHTRLEDLVVDDHGSPVPPLVWAAYASALQSIGPRPTLIEWDNDVPAWYALLNEVRQAREVMLTEVQRTREMTLTDVQRTRETTLTEVQRVREMTLKSLETPADAHIELSASTARQPISVEAATSVSSTTATAAIAATTATPATPVSPLADAQSRFLQSLLSPHDESIDGLRALPGVSGGVARGLQAYRLNGAALAAKALSAVFPRLHDQLEQNQPGSFAALAWTCWRHNGPTTADIGDWGDALIQRLAEAETHDGAPSHWTDLARLEWAQHRSGRALTVAFEAASLTKLEQHEPDALTLRLQDAVQLISVSDSAQLQALLTPATSLSAVANSAMADSTGTGIGTGPDNDNDNDITSSHGAPATWVVWQQDWEPHAEPLDNASAAFMRSLLAGDSLEQALALAEACDDRFDFSHWCEGAWSRQWLRELALMHASPPLVD